jgi:hypothetical protein
MYIVISIIQYTLNLTCWFIDLQKKIVEKANGQTNEKSQWCHIFKNGGGNFLSFLHSQRPMIQ